MYDNPGIDTTVPTLGDALRYEIVRVRAISKQDAHARFAVKYAEKSIKDGDVCRMINALNALKAKQET
jgi:hypothetical protein